jgi:hypothetical protein
MDLFPLVFLSGDSTPASPLAFGKYYFDFSHYAYAKKSTSLEKAC